jgi:hypothetical protein
MVVQSVFTNLALLLTSGPPYFSSFDSRSQLSTVVGYIIMAAWQFRSKSGTLKKYYKPPNIGEMLLVR